MGIEDRIRTSVDTRLAKLRARVDQEVEAMVDELVGAALEDRQEALAAAQVAALEEADRRLRDAEMAAESRVQSALAEAGVEAARALQQSVNEARVREREAELAAVVRLLDSIRTLDRASSLGEVFDALGQAAGREATRAAVLVLRNDRLLGWRLSGFGARDTQPKSIDLGLSESGVIGQALAAGHPVTTREATGTAAGPGFIDLPADRLGLAIPLIVGGRGVAVVYADTAGPEEADHTVPSGWPEVIEVLARHAARCLEALTVQKVAAASSPRFWVPAAGTSTENAAARQGAAAPSASSAPTESGAPPNIGV
jgi:hypothetical protein